jgi:hypothetical protein
VSAENVASLWPFVFALWVLATLDGAFIGFRAAAGRSGLIRKTQLYRRSMLKGALATQFAALLVLIAAWACVRWAPDGPNPFHSFQTSVERMLIVYAPYALLLLIAVVLRTLPDVDLRSALSMVIFGPLTLFRPLVCLGGALWALWDAYQPWSGTPVLLAAVLMLSLGPLLDSWLAPSTSSA